MLHVLLSWQYRNKYLDIFCAVTILFVDLQRKQQRPSLSMSANPDVSAVADYPPDGGHDTGGRTPRSGLLAYLTGLLLMIGWD